MDFSETLHNFAVRFSEFPVWGILLVKASAILAMAWLLHFALVRLNPRWRMFLWRGTAVGLAILGIWAVGLPGVVVRVPTPPPAKTDTVAAISVKPVEVPGHADAVSEPSLKPMIVREPVEMSQNAVNYRHAAEIGRDQERFSDGDVEG